MKYFEQAKENLKRSNFFKALELFELSLKEDALSDELKVFCCEKIERINEVLGKETTSETLNFLANHYFELGVFDKSQLFFEKLFNDSGDVQYLKKQFLSLINSGDVSNSTVRAQQYLEELGRRRLSNEILKFLNDHRTIFSQQDISSWSFRAHFLSGNISAVEKEIETWSELNERDQREIYQLAFDLIGHDAKYWHSSSRLTSLLWEKLVEEDTPFILSKKSFIKLCLDFWLTHNIDQDLIRQTLTLSEKYKLPILAHEIAKFVGDEELADKYLMQMPREALTTDNFDFGEDLFQSKEEDEVKKLERDINFLVKSGKKAEALKLAYRLEKMEPGHPILAGLLESHEENPELGSVERYQALLKDIEKYSGDKSNDDSSEAQFQSLVKHYDYNFLQENYEDMVVGFNLINLPVVALEIIERVDKRRLSDREKVNLDYLKVETLIAAERFFEARDLVEDVLAQVPLVKEERLAFQYLRAESYWKLQKYDIAHKLFNDIAKRYPNYRLTNQRLLAIEKN